MNLKFIDSPIIAGGENRYATLEVNVKSILKSWRSSLFSFEWLTPDLTIKSIEDLPEKERIKREMVEQAIKDGKPLETPILGIGMIDNVEIGSGKAVFLTVAAHGAEKIPVHVPTSHIEDFKAFTDNL